jgi:DNA-binding PadR family transcriptional regulator
MARSRRPRAEGFLPLSPARFHVLVALSGGERHGYAILKDVERLSEGKVRFSASTLYSVLDRLEEDGLIEESSVRPDAALDDERRRYYRLTRLGTKVAEAETSRLENVLAALRERRLGRSST